AGLTQQFNATAFDENGIPAGITWAVTGSIGSIDSDGLFTAGATPGEGTVTASAVGLTKAAEITVTVDPVLTLTPVTVSLRAGLTQQFTADATDENGNSADVEWAASEGIGTISSNGLFTAGSDPGDGTVTASAVGLTRTANITVTVDPVLTLTPTEVSIHAGDTQQFSATATDENGAAAIVIWEVTDDIGTVDANGLFTAGDSPGDGTVIASAVGLTETADITVTVDPVLTLTPTTVSIQALGTQQFTATAFDENGATATVTWDVTGNIGSVDSDGLFTAGANPGSGTLTASAVGLTEMAQITVTVDPVLNMSPETVSLRAGLTQQFIATAFDENGVAATVTWAVTGDIGTVDSDGFFTAGTNPGVGAVTASAVGLTKAANVTVTVDPVLTLTPTTVSIHAGDTQQFTAIATDENGNSAIVEWAASEGIGNISPDGLFTAGESAGDGTVTASAVGLTETADITVTVDPVLTLTPTEVILHAGDTQQFVATAFDENNDPAEITWSVSGDIGTVDENGLFTAGETAGSGTVTASAVGLTETAEVTVKVDPVLTLTPTSVNLMDGETQQFIATATDEDGNPAPITWTTSGDIGTVDSDGLFTATDAGSGIVTASAVGLTVTANITVTIDLILHSITITPQEATLQVGENIQFSVSAQNSDGEDLPPSALNDVVLSVTGNIGEITNNSKVNPRFLATNQGVGAIVATLGEITAQATITVTGDAVLTLTPTEVSLHAGETQQFTAVAIDENGNPAEVTWAVTGDIGTVNTNGFFTAGTDPGVGTVTASAVGLTRTADITVTVDPTLTLTPTTVSLRAGLTQQFTALATDENGDPATVTWAVTNNIGTVDSNGLFTAGTDPGAGTVTASAEGLTRTANITVTVDPVLTLTPTEVSLRAGLTQQFTAASTDENGNSAMGSH
ncbi:beta strand repeat-containing protein, partial [Candidatus Latescibacterota bacterium]